MPFPEEEPSLHPEYDARQARGLQGRCPGPQTVQAFTQQHGTGIRRRRRDQRSRSPQSEKRRVR